MPSLVEMLVGWLALLGVALLLLGCVAAMVWWQRWRSRPSAVARSAARAEATRQAAALADRIDHAEHVLAQARARAHTAEQEQTAAWQALQDAQHAYDQAARAYAEAVQQRSAWVGGRDGAQVLTHAAFAAFRRGDLSGDQLLAVSRLAIGWDEDLHQQELQVARLRVAHREAQTHYRAAASRSRVAAAEYDVAEVALRALTDEVVQTAAEVVWAEQQPAASMTR